MRPRTWRAHIAGMAVMTILAIPATSIVAGCPARPAGSAGTRQVADLTLPAAEILRAGLVAEDVAIQQETATLLLTLPVESLTAHGQLGSQLGDALLARVSAGDASLQTQQWFIDQLADSAFWKSLTPERRAEVLGWTREGATAPEMESREVAAYAIFRLGGEAHLADLVPLLTDKERTVRAIVAEGFGRYGGGVEWPTMRRLAEDPNEYVRLRAAKAMAQWTVRLGGDLDIDKRNEVLAKLKDDPDPFVQRMVAQVYGIDTLYQREAYRQQIYQPLLRGTSLPAEGPEWEAFRDIALGNFDWSLGHDLPVPQGIADLVFEFLWQDYPELQPDILEAIALMPTPEDRRFLQIAWDSGIPSLRMRVLELLRELIERRGTLAESVDPIIEELAGWDWVEQEPELRDEALRLLLLIARSQMLARFDDAAVQSWETKFADLYYSPRASVRVFVGKLNPAHPWLDRAAKVRFANDDRLRETLPRLARMHWFGDDPRRIDPATNAYTEDGSFPLTDDDWLQIWRWGIVPPAAVLSDILVDTSDQSLLSQIRAAAIVLRGPVELKPLVPNSSGSDDFVDPRAIPESPDDSLFLS